MKNIKIKKINKSKNLFFKKVWVLTIVFAFWIYIFSIDTSTQNFFTDISKYWKWLVTTEKILDEKDEIKDEQAIWPFRKVVDRWRVHNYQSVRNKSWDEVPEDKRTPFPNEVSHIVDQYRFVNPNRIWETVSNPLERQKVTFYKRLLTTLWTASYECNQNNCKRWDEWTWTHAGIDIVNPKWTPVYNSMNWIVLDKQEWNWWFWNYVIIWTNFEWELLATFYAHLDEIDNNIEKWDIINRWENIWTVWTSWTTTVSHLHFQINTLWDIEDISDIEMANKLREEWQNGTIEWVKNSTKNPISFIENNLQPVTDAFEEIDTDYEEEMEEVEEEEAEEIMEEVEEEDKTEDDDLLDQIVWELWDEYTHEAAWEEKEPFKIQNIYNPKIWEELIKWDNIEFEVETSWEQWQITITTNNNVLEPSKTTISPEDWEKQTVNILAQNMWNWRIIFNDGKNKKDFYFSVYEESAEAYWLSIEWPNTIYTTKEENFSVYLMDQYWWKLNRPMEWKLSITLVDNDWNENDIWSKKAEWDKESIDFDIKSPKAEDYKLKAKFEADWQTLRWSKNVNSEVFTDYSINDNYWNSMKYLNEQRIVQWHNWKLMPKDNIERSEVITILARHKHWAETEKFKEEMNEYIEEKWRFLEDISWNERYAPYVFKAYKDWIVKWAWWTHANANQPIEKAELLAMYGRFFDTTRNENFTNFMDVNNDDWFKKYADAAKNYSLYPFEESDYMNPHKHVNREKAFESLYRYIQLSPEEYQTAERSQEEELEDAVRTLINF